LEIKAGREFRVDKTGIVHSPVAISFDALLAENAQAGGSDQAAGRC
jgi:hypothetical protein